MKAIHGLEIIIALESASLTSLCLLSDLRRSTTAFCRLANPRLPITALRGVAPFFTPVGIPRIFWGNIACPRL